MKKTPQTLEHVGALLYGPQWRGALSEALNVSPRTMRRWQLGEFNMPDGVWSDIADACEQQANDLLDWADKLRSKP